MPKKKDDKVALQLIFVVIFVIITIHSMFWTLNTFDPINPQYRNLELQFGFQLMHMLLFFWMLIAVLLAFGRFYKRKSK